MNIADPHSAARFRELADAMPQIVWTARPDGTPEYYNRRWYEFTGFPEDRLNESAWIGLLHPDDLQPTLDTWKGALQSGLPYEIEYRFQDRRRGGYRWFLGRALPVRDAAGVIQRWHGTCTDIDDLRRAEGELAQARQDLEARVRQRTLEFEAANEELRHKEQRYRSLVEATTAIVWDTPASGEFEVAQPAWSAFTGQSFAELRGWGWLNAVHPDDRPETARVWSAAVASRSIYVVEHRLHRHDGVYRHMMVRAVPILADDGSIREWIGVHTDITEQKEAEHAIEEARQAAESANRTKSEFLANMSHEIRTPLNGIIGMAELLSRTTLDREQREFVEIIQSSGDTLLCVINDVLDLSKIEACRLEIDPFDFALRDHLADMLKPLALRASKKNVELAYEVTERVPDALYGDWNRLQQVLLNLIGNAIKFTEQGEIILSIDAAPVDDAAVELRASVRDTGIGIPADRLTAVFAPFVQADGAMARKYGGTGLGLAICQKLLELMGGRIWVESTPGAGSVFRFTVQLRRARSAPTAPPAADLKALHGCRVLVVDDNATNRRLLEVALQGWGMPATLCDSGAAALQALNEVAARRQRFDLVLVDMNMPELDGLTLCERIQADPTLAGHTLLMLSSADRQEDARRCREIGVGAYLTKPIKLSELLQTLARVLGRDGPARAEPPAATSPPTALRPLRILLAEDNYFNQRVATGLLERHGHSVQVANNGHEAVALMSQGPWDVVLMDVQMPEMDGLQATAQIRAAERGSGRHQRIVALTAHAVKGDRERFLEAGMDGYVTKPLHWDELNQALQDIMADADANGAVPAPAGRFDRAGTLERVGGDEDLLREATALFLGQCPALLTQIQEAVRVKDADQLRRTAHKLKGSIGLFGAAAAHQAVQQLETLGEQRNLDGCAEPLARLADEIALLLPELRAAVAQ